MRKFKTRDNQIYKNIELHEWRENGMITTYYDFSLTELDRKIFFTEDEVVTYLKSLFKEFELNGKKYEKV